MHTTHRDSSAIVDFISRLWPLYTDEVVGERRCARSLRGGSLIRAAKGPKGDEAQWVEVFWQGAGGKGSLVRAALMAQLAIGDYAQFHSRGKPARYRDELEHLVEHFRLKTGTSTAMPGEQVIEVFGVLGKLVNKLGWLGLLAALKALL